MAKKKTTTRASTDRQVVEVARQIEQKRREIEDLIALVTYGNHPNADEITEELIYQCSFPAWATHVVRRHLSHPERWQTHKGNKGLGIRRMTENNRIDEEESDRRFAEAMQSHYEETED